MGVEYRELVAREFEYLIREALASRGFEVGLMNVLADKYDSLTKYFAVLVEASRGEFERLVMSAMSVAAGRWPYAGSEFTVESVELVGAEPRGAGAELEFIVNFRGSRGERVSVLFTVHVEVVASFRYQPGVVKVGVDVGG